MNNRKQRRNQGKELQKMSNAEASEFIRNIYKEGVQNGIAKTMTMTLEVLHEDYGFRDKRKESFTNKLKDKFKEYSNEVKAEQEKAS